MSCDCGKTNPIQNCCSNSCGDYCTSSSCSNYSTICSIIPDNCSCQFTNCPPGTLICSGYMTCVDPVQTCADSHMIINGAFCISNGFASNRNVSVCELYNARSTKSSTYAPSPPFSEVNSFAQINNSNFGISNDDDWKRKPAHKPSRRPTTVSPIIFPSYSQSFEPTIYSSFIPSSIPILLPSKIPYYIPSVTPSCKPSSKRTLSPAFDSSTTPNIQPSSILSQIPSGSMSTVNPSSHESSSILPSIKADLPSCQPSIAPIVNKINSCARSPNGDSQNLLSAYFTSQQLIENITISTFTQSDVSESFVQAVQCAMINSRTVGDLLISITGISQATVSPTALRNFHMQGSSGTSAAVDVQYSVMFQFPIPQNISRTNSRMKVYYDLLTKQLTSSVSSSEFLYLFREYMVENGVDLEASHLETVSATQPPLYSSPILATVAPTATPVSSMTDSVSTTQPSLVNAVVTAVSVVIGVLFLCVLYAMYSIYRQYQLYQERDAQKLHDLSISPHVRRISFNDSQQEDDCCDANI